MSGVVVSIILAVSRQIRANWCWSETQSGGQTKGSEGIDHASREKCQGWLTDWKILIINCDCRFLFINLLQWCLKMCPYSFYSMNFGNTTVIYDILQNTKLYFIPTVWLFGTVSKVFVNNLGYNDLWPTIRAIRYTYFFFIPWNMDIWGFACQK